MHCPRETPKEMTGCLLAVAVVVEIVALGIGSVLINFGGELGLTMLCAILLAPALGVVIGVAIRRVIWAAALGVVCSYAAIAGIARVALLVSGRPADRLAWDICLVMSGIFGSVAGIPTTVFAAMFADLTRKKSSAASSDESRVQETGA